MNDKKWYQVNYIDKETGYKCSKDFENVIDATKFFAKVRGENVIEYKITTIFTEEDLE